LRLRRVGVGDPNRQDEFLIDFEDDVNPRPDLRLDTVRSHRTDHAGPLVEIDENNRIGHTIPKDFVHGVVHDSETMDGS
jgi:hypothetical protein